MQSGMILSSDQSPPPITFPARTVARTFPRCPFAVEEGRPVSGAYKLRAPLAGAVRVVAAHGVALAVSPGPFPVLVAFVARHVDYRRDRIAEAAILEHVDSAPDVCIEGLLGVPVSPPYEGLGSEVEDELRLEVVEDGLQAFEVPHVAPDIGKAVGETGDDEIVPFRNGREGIPRHLGAQLQEPGSQPGPLETRVARNEDPFASVSPAKEIARPFHPTRPSRDSAPIPTAR